MENVLKILTWNANMSLWTLLLSPPYLKVTSLTPSTDRSFCAQEQRCAIWWVVRDGLINGSGSRPGPLGSVESCDRVHYGAWNAPQTLLGSLAGPSDGHLLPFLLLSNHASDNSFSWSILEQYLASMFSLYIPVPEAYTSPCRNWVYFRRMVRPCILS